MVRIVCSASDPSPPSAAGAYHAGPRKAKRIQHMMFASAPLRIGVLALQGDFREHLAVLQRLGALAHPVRLPRDIADTDGLIIPGGESTVMGKLMVEYGLDEPLRERIAAGTPVWGTCAGLILLSRETDNALAGQPLLAAMDIRTRRNAFGAQRASFEADLAVPALGDPPFHAVFIRAPAVESVGSGVEVLARLDGADNVSHA